MAEAARYNSNSKLSSLLKRVDKGETVVITRRGHAVAALTPVREDEELAPNQAVDRMLKFQRRKGARTLTVAQILELRDQGRR